MKITCRLVAVLRKDDDLVLYLSLYVLTLVQFIQSLIILTSRFFYYVAEIKW